MTDKSGITGPTRQLLILVATAAVFRILFLTFASDSAFLHTPVVDASFFDIWARTMANGKPFMPGTFFKPPFYPYLLAQLYKSGMNMTAVFVLQMGIGVLTTVMTLLIGRQVFSPRVAFGGAMATALLPILPFFEVQLLAETWTTALSMGSIFLILMVITQKTKSAGRLLFAAGLLLGAATTGRPNLMLFMATIAVWVFFSNRRHPQKLAINTSAMLMMLAGFLLALAPTTLNNLKNGDFIPVSANLGANLVAGNSDTADGMSPIPVGILWDDLQLQAKQAGHDKPADASRYLTAEALGWMADNPVQTIKLTGKKVLLLINAAEVRNNINPTWFAQEDGVFLLSRWWPGTWLLLPFSLLGLIFYRNNNPGLQLLYWFLLSQAVAVLPFFVNARFRMPLLPVLALFAAAGVALIWKNRRSFNRPIMIKIMATLLILLGVVNVDWFHLQDPRWLARDFFNQGFIQSRAYADRKPDAVQAEKFFRKSLDLDPNDADANARLGGSIMIGVEPLLSQGSRLEQSGKIDKATLAFQKADARLLESQKFLHQAVRIYPRAFRVWSNLGTGKMWRGDLVMFKVRQHLAAEETAGARSLALQSLSLYKNSIENFNQSLKINPRQKSTQQSLSLAWKAIMQIPDLDPAITEVQDFFRDNSRKRR